MLQSHNSTGARATCWADLRAAVELLLSTSQERILERIVGTRQMDVRHEIAKQVEALPEEMQEQVLRFVASLAGSVPKGERGAALRQFSSSLDAVSAGEMAQTIEEGCERVDAGEW